MLLFKARVVNTDVNGFLYVSAQFCSTSLPVRMVGVTKCPVCQQVVPSKGHIVIPYTQGFVKVSKRSVVRYGIQITSKVAELSKTYGLPQGLRPYVQLKWCHLLVPIWWPRLWSWIHRGNLQDLWWKIQRAF